MRRDRQTPGPSLDAVANTPEQLAALPRPVLLGLKRQLVVLLVDVDAALLDVTAPAPAPSDTEHALTTQQAAARLGVAPITLYRRSKRSPYAELRIDTGTRTVRFSSRRLEAFLCRVRPEGHPSPPLERRKGLRMARPASDPMREG